MQRLIAWLLKRYTPFRVLAWDRGKIAGIGGPNPWLHLDSERIDQVNSRQLWAEQQMGKLEPAEALKLDGEGNSAALGTGGIAARGKDIAPPKPWPLDRRVR